MEGIMVWSIIYWVIVIGLIALFVISFTLFIRRLFVNQTVKMNKIAEIEKKLDNIIELLEKDRQPR
ncbi:hypothetical protein XYCOK13_23100 [Xylanibacillus composti]|uniref:DUF4083 domain-containing protein n=2 Tax=Xylanibacillus composti TaxID=1572762 RepID=A0A8J4M3F8_9BACL|nr:hypothetical protein XYCOK13_23100 [Xylanibacillus composti]